MAHTWSNYADEGLEGPPIADGQTVAIVWQGQRIHSGRWQHLVVQDRPEPVERELLRIRRRFDNNGSTSGSLIGTPFVDPNVANCRSALDEVPGATRQKTLNCKQLLAHLTVELTRKRKWKTFAIW